MEIVILMIFLVSVLVWYFRNSFQYWERKKVPFIKPHFPLGNNEAFLPDSFTIGALSKKFYNELKNQGYRFGGVYFMTHPCLVIVDPKYLKDIMATDFNHFIDRGVYFNENDPIAVHLFNVNHNIWKDLRMKLTPTFTSGKMKMMFHMMLDCANYMKDYLETNTGKNLNLKDLCGRFTTDVIGICAFGITCNSFKYPNAEFRVLGERIFSSNYFRKFQLFFMINFPKLAVKMRIPTIKREVEHLLRRLVKDTISLRAQINAKYTDFLQLILDMKETSDFSFENIVSQVFLFFVAGFDTSSTAMMFCLYELAQHEDLQERLRNEINAVLKAHNGILTYESLNEMKFLDQVLNETLRMYPPLSTLNRRCTKDYILEDTDIQISKGTDILISVLGLHRDPEYFPNPDEFNPDRFSPENKKNIKPFTYMPFGQGPRNCIGLRFGVMQVKIGLITIITHFQLMKDLNSKKPDFASYGILLKSMNPVHLNFKPIMDS